jgi:hypothetical protein
MSYVVKQDGKAYKIYDTKNKKFIQKSYTKQEADKVARKLNLGSGFGDWTPDFFNYEYNIVYK